MASRIEYYAMIGDCKTAALVGLDGSIDWLCLPRFDSASCFGSLIGTEEHGVWRLAPVDKVRRVSRSYLDGSLIVRTESETNTGKVQLTDFMSINQEGSHVVRPVRGLRGTVKFRLKLVVRFGYGITVPWPDQLDPRTLVLVAGSDIRHEDSGSGASSKREISYCRISHLHEWRTLVEAEAHHTADGESSWHSSHGIRRRGN